jgi:hypothetical protein
VRVPLLAHHLFQLTTGFSAGGAVASRTTACYVYEKVTVNCTANLINITITISVQKTVNATYSGAFSTFAVELSVKLIQILHHKSSMYGQWLVVKLFKLVEVHTLHKLNFHCLVSTK